MRVMPPQEVADFMYKLDRALADLQLHQPDQMIVDVKLTWYGEDYAVLREEGWNLL